MQDALEDDRESRAVAQRRQVLPAQPRIRVDVEERLDRGARFGRAQVRDESARVVAGHREQRLHRAGRDLHVVLRGRVRAGDAFADDLAEPRVGGVLRDAEALRERQRTEVEVLRAPAEHGRVERDDQCAGVDRLGPGDQAVDESSSVLQYSCTQRGGVPHRRGAVLHRVAALVRVDVRHADGRRRPRDLEVAVRRASSAPAPTGASSSGLASFVLSTVVVRSRWLMPCAIRGTIAHRSKARRLLRMVRALARAAGDVAPGARAELARRARCSSSAKSVGTSGRRPSAPCR